MPNDFDCRQQDEALRTANEELQARGEELLAQAEELQTQADELAAANQELERSEERFRALTQSSPDLITRYDGELRLVYANEAVLRRTGMTEAQFVGKTAHQYGASPQALIRESIEWAGGNRTDDIAIIVIERTG